MAVDSGPDAAGSNHPVSVDKLGVFISYSRDDVEIADTLDVLLENTGFAPTLDRQGISGAEDWKERLGGMIRDTDTVVFLLSPASAKSDICRWEVAEALRLSKRVVPIACKSLEGVSPPPELAALNYIYFYADPKVPGSGVKSGTAELVKTLKSDLAWMRQHTRYLQRAIEWETGGKSPNRLLSGNDIAIAKTWAARRPNDAPAPTPLQLDFIKASEAWEAEQANERARELAERERIVAEYEQARADRERAQAAREAAERAAADLARQNEEAARREADLARDNAVVARREAEQARLVKQRTFVGLLGAVLLALVASGFGLLAKSERDEAQRQTQRALDAGKEAAFQAVQAEARKIETEKLREATQVTEAGLLAISARQLIDPVIGRDSATAALLALEGLPDKSSDDPQRQKRPYVPEAELQADLALRNIGAHPRETFVLDGYKASWSPDGSRIVTATLDAVGMWEARTGREIFRVDGHGDKFLNVLWSPTGSLIATVSFTRAQIRDSATGKEIAQLGSWRVLRDVEWSPDGSKIAVAIETDGAGIWEAATGKEIVRLKGHTGSVFWAGWSPDGTRIVTTSNDRTARVWDSTGKELAKLEHPNDVVDAAVWRPDGARLVTASWDRIARVWDVSTAKELVRLVGHNGFITKLVWSTDGSLILTASDDGTARLWDAETGRPILRMDHNDSVATVAWSPDRSRIATASIDNTARIWDATTGKELSRLEGHDGGVLSAQWSPDGTQIVTASGDRSTRIWSLADQNIIAIPRHNGPLAKAAWSPDGARIAATASNMALIWHATESAVVRLEGHRSEISDIHWKSDGKQLVTASQDKTARIWDAQTGTELARLEGHARDVTTASWNSSGHSILTTSGDDTARVWDAATGKELAQLKATDASRLFGAEWSPDGHRVVTAHGVGTAIVWDAASAGEVFRLRGRGWIKAARWSPDGKRIITVSPGAIGDTRVWDATTGTEIYNLAEDNGGIISAVWSPDSTLILTSAGRIVRVWDATTGRIVSNLLGHIDSAVAVQWSADGSRVLTRSSDGTARIWEAKTGKEVARQDRIGDRITGAALSPIGSPLWPAFLTTSASGAAHIWKVSLSTDDLVQRVKAQALRCLTQAQREAFFLSKTPPSWCVERKLWPYHTEAWQAWLPKHQAWIAAGRQGAEPELPQ